MIFNNFFLNSIISDFMRLEIFCHFMSIVYNFQSTKMLVYNLILELHNYIHEKQTYLKKRNQLRIKCDNSLKTNNNNNVLGEYTINY